MEYATNLVFAVVAAVFVRDVVRAYRAAVGSWFPRLVEAAKKAARSMWTGFTIGVSAVFAVLAQLADLVNAPSIGTALQTYGQPKYVAIVMIAVAFVLEMDRRRKS